jgi:hypothetical protein
VGELVRRMQVVFRNCAGNSLSKNVEMRRAPEVRQVLVVARAVEIVLGEKGDASALGFDSR